MGATITKIDNKLARGLPRGPFVARHNGLSFKEHRSGPVTTHASMTCSDSLPLRNGKFAGFRPNLHLSQQLRSSRSRSEQLRRCSGYRSISSPHRSWIRPFGRGGCGRPFPAIDQIWLRCDAARHSRRSLRPQHWGSSIARGAQDMSAG